MKVYVASPLGFSEAGREFYYNTLIPALEADGKIHVNDPWKLTDLNEINRVLSMPYGPEKRDAWVELNEQIGYNNRIGIERSDAILAVLDGPDVDSGTAAEVGYGYGIGLLVVGYRNDFRLSADNEGSTVNLQVEYFIRKSGGTILTNYKLLQNALVLLYNAKHE